MEFTTTAGNSCRDKALFPAHGVQNLAIVGSEAFQGEFHPGKALPDIVAKGN